MLNNLKMNKSYIRIIYNKILAMKRKEPCIWIYDNDFNSLIKILKKYPTIYKILIK